MRRWLRSLIWLQWKLYKSTHQCWQLRVISLSFMDPSAVLQLIQITGIQQGPAIPYAKTHLIIPWKWVTFKGNIFRSLFETSRSLHWITANCLPQLLTDHCNEVWRDSNGANLVPKNYGSINFLNVPSIACVVLSLEPCVKSPS